MKLIDWRGMGRKYWFSILWDLVFLVVIFVLSFVGKIVIEQGSGIAKNIFGIIILLVFAGIYSWIKWRIWRLIGIKGKGFFTLFWVNVILFGISCLLLAVLYFVTWGIVKKEHFRLSFGIMAIILLVLLYIVMHLSQAEYITRRKSRSILWILRGVFSGILLLIIVELLILIGLNFLLGRIYQTIPLIPVISMVIFLLFNAYNRIIIARKTSAIPDRKS